MTFEEFDKKASEYSYIKYSLPVDEIVFDESTRKEIFEGDDPLKKIIEEIDYYADKYDLILADTWAANFDAFTVDKAIRVNGASKSIIPKKRGLEK